MTKKDLFIGFVLAALLFTSVPARAEAPMTDYEKMLLEMKQMKEKEKQPKSDKLTKEDCFEDDMDGYCWWDLAEQEQDVTYCGAYESKEGFTDCFNSVYKLRKLGAMDCEFVQENKELCLELVKNPPQTQNQTKEK